MSETDLRRAIQLAASEQGARLFRNNTGMGWTGTVRHVGSEVHISNPRPLHAGLFKGSSDLIGWTAEGRFVAIEIKTPRMRTTDEQRQFIKSVRTAGGCGGIAYSVEDALAILAAG